MAVTVSGEPLLSPWLLLRALTTRRGRSFPSDHPDSLSDRLGGQPQLFAYGRQALAAALQDLGEKRQILVPAYICDTVVDGIKAAGWRWRFYPTGDRLEPHWSWLERNRHPSDTAILLVHYFGFPSDVGHAARFARNHHLSLIEDCAHAFQTAVASHEIGRAGTASFYSWRKFLPVANGAALVGRAHQNRGAERSQFGGAAAARELCKWLLFKTGSRTLLRHLGPVVSDEPDSRSGGAGTTVPHWIASRVLATETLHLPRVAKRRRDNYRRLFDSLAGFWQVKVLTPRLSEQAVPWCLALTVQGARARNSLVEHLLRRGIGAWPWPELPPDVTPEAFPREFQLASETICLPVHQDLGSRHMRQIARAIDGWQHAR